MLSSAARPLKSQKETKEATSAYLAELMKSAVSVRPEPSTALAADALSRHTAPTSLCRTWTTSVKVGKPLHIWQMLPVLAVRRFYLAMSVKDAAVTNAVLVYRRCSKP